MPSRKTTLRTLTENRFDVVIVGGGIKGACVYRAAVRMGYRAALVERGDFACGSSQSSAMMIWGGLLYLRDGDLSAVWSLTRERERMLREDSAAIQPMESYYLPAGGDFPVPLVRTALYAAWLLGLTRRKRPRSLERFDEQAFLRPTTGKTALSFEEARELHSDARLVLRHILPPLRSDSPAINYCELVGGGFESEPLGARLELRDRHSGRDFTVRTRLVVNTAGAWTEDVEKRFGLESPYTHVLSKGVFIALPRRPEHRRTLIMETGKGGDCMTLMPWGPVSLWGPTETTIREREAGFRPEPEDVKYLLTEINAHFLRPVGPEHVVSLRCGLRTLALPKGRTVPTQTWSLSRRFYLWSPAARPWISIYGGKLTDGPKIGRRVAALLRRRLPASGLTWESAFNKGEAVATTFPGLNETVPDPQWCAEHEQCCRLEDYLRRRTNIAQWTARGGLGLKDENRSLLERWAARMLNDDAKEAERQVEAYRQLIWERHDCVLKTC